MNPLKQLFRRFAHFLSGNVAARIFGLVTFPILTRALTTEQYGVLALVTTTVMLVIPFAKAGLTDGILRYYKQYSNDPRELTVFTSTVLLRGIALSLITTAAYVLLLPHTLSFLRVDSRFISAFLVVTVSIFLRPLNGCIFNFLIVTGKTLAYNLLSFFSSLVGTCLSLYLLLFVVKELYAFFAGGVVAEFVLSIVLIYWFLTNYGVSFRAASTSVAFQLIRFGAPLLLTELSYLLLSYLDRYMIILFLGETALGMYSVGYNLAMYIANTLTFGLSYAAVPLFVDIYETHGKKSTEDFLTRAMYYSLILFLPVCTGYFAIARDLFTVLASAKYSVAADFSPYIFVGSALLGLSNSILNAGLYVQKKSTTILGIMLSALVVNFLLNLVLIPRYEVLGAAMASCIACVCATVLTVVLSYRYLAIRIPLVPFMYYFGASLAMALGVYHIVTAKPWLNVALKVVCGIMIMGSAALLWETRLFRKPLRISG